MDPSLRPGPVSEETLHLSPPVRRPRHSSEYSPFQRESWLVPSGSSLAVPDIARISTLKGAELARIRIRLISPSLVLSPRALRLPICRSSGRCRCSIRRGPSLGIVRRQPRCHPDTQTYALARSDPAQKSAAPSHVLHQDPHRTYGNSTGTTGPDAPFPAAGPSHPHAEVRSRIAR